MKRSGVLFGALIALMLYVSVYAEDGSVLWKQAPIDLTGWYWMYDNAEPTPPFISPLMPSLPSWSNIVGLPDAHKCAPYSDRPYAYELEDSFWFYGYWYKPGDELYIGCDGWLSFDASIEIDGAPNPPLAEPPIPVVDAPNELMAALWADYNLTYTPEPTTENRVFYLYDSKQRILRVQWNTVRSATTPSNIYTFAAWIQMGGQLLLDKLGSCGVVFSHHFIHFLYNTCSNTWIADNAIAGIEDQGGTHGILYGGTFANGRVTRAGYKKTFQHDVRAEEWLCPGRIFLRYTDVEPCVRVGNAGTEAEHFTVTADIYDSEGERVYHQNLGAYDLLPGSSKNIKAPCWVPGELGEEYNNVLYVQLANDECHANDTLIRQTIIHCDDTVGYDWNFGDASPSQGSAWMFEPEYHALTWYGAPGGLITGGRHYMEAGSWLPNVYQSKMELFKATTGCGTTNMAGLVVKVPLVNNPEVGGWNKAIFPGFGVYVPATTPGNIFIGVTAEPPGNGYSTGAVTNYGMNFWPDSFPCYLGSGPGRGAMIGSSGAFSWGSYPNNDPYYTPATEYFSHLIFGEYPLSPWPQSSCYWDNPHDLNAYEMTHPAEDWVESGVAITPEIAIANIGRQKEPDADFFDVKFIAVDEETGETAFSKTTLINKIGWLGDASDNPDTLYVAIEPWTPQGKCADAEPNGTGPFVNLELIGLVDLGVVGPDEGDHCPYNDTVRRNVVVLLTHDVGVTEIVFEPEVTPPDKIPAGTAVTITATVENFGYNQESNVPVRCEILDKTADPDTLVYHNIQTIVTLDWRGNTLDNPYTAEVTFPVWTVPSTNWFTITCKTELAGDMCPDDDFEVLNPGAIDEGKTGPKAYFLEVTNAINEGEARLRFAVLHSDWVKISVFDINGRYVASVQNDPMEPGYYTRTWNGKDDSGRKCSAGIYIVRMEAEGFTASKKAVILN